MQWGPLMIMNVNIPSQQIEDVHKLTLVRVPESLTTLGVDTNPSAKCRDPKQLTREQVDSSRQAFCLLGVQNCKNTKLKHDVFALAAVFIVH